MSVEYNCAHMTIQNWRRLNRSGPWPEERTSHAACCLNYGQQFPLLLMTGGMDRQNKPLGDAWILDIDRGNWRKVRLKFTLCVVYIHIIIVFTIIVQVSVPLKARWGHSLTAISLCPGLTEVVEFGGSPDHFTGSNETQPKMADTTLLEFSECPCNLLHACAVYVPECIECKPVVCKKVPVGVVWAKVYTLCMLMLGLTVFRSKVRKLLM